MNFRRRILRNIRTYLVLITLTLVSALLFLTSHINNARAQVADLALNKPFVSVSSTAAGSNPANAVDGNPATFWTSGGGGSQWLGIDLGTSTFIGTVVVNWGSQIATDYSIEFSDDGINYASVWSGINGNFNNVVNRSGRYVLIRINSGSDPNGYQLGSLEVYAGTLPNPTPTPGVSPTTAPTLAPLVTPTPTPIPNQPSVSGTIITNNSNIDASVIPLTNLNTARNLDILFNHQSTGYNILSGIDDLASQNPSRYTVIRIGNPAAAWYDSNSGIGDFTAGSNGDPNSKVVGFTNLLTTYAGHIKVAFMKFCWIDFWPNTSYTGQQIWDMYRPVMQSLIQAYPNVTFVWVTAPLQDLNTNNREHAAFSTLVRQYIAANGGVLFDIADIESRDPAGNLILDRNGYPALYSGYTTDGGHLSDAGNVGRDRVANAWWSLMARISGWGGAVTPTPTPTTIATASATPAATPAITPTPAPSATPAPCTITSVSWPNGTTSVVEGTNVNISVTVSGACSGKQVHLTARRNISLQPDVDAANQPTPRDVSLIVSGNTATASASWKVDTWTNSCLIGSCNPTYFAKGQLINPDGTYNSTEVTTDRNNDLKVTKSSIVPTDWPQLQKDSQHKGRTSVQVDPPYQAAWVWMDKNHIVRNFVSQPGSSITDGFADRATYTQPVMLNAKMQPIVAQNRVFFGALDGTFYAVDAATGNNLWDFTTGGPLLAAAAFDSGIAVFGSMDGKVYGIDATTGPVNGQPKWAYQTGAGVNAPPVISNGVVYIGSRDGKFYALDVVSGTLKWSKPYTTRVEPADANSPFNGASVVSAAAVSEDGSTVFFGSENTYFYALNTVDGSEKWAPKKLYGQSFQDVWPVVRGNLVMITSMSSYGTPEYNMESVLDALPATPTWQQERDAINTWLNANPQWKLFRVFNIADGSEPFQVAAGPYAPFGNAFIPPIVDNQDRILWPYWRVKDATFFQTASCYGSKYGLDVSAMDPATGDRIALPNNQPGKFCPEIDNVFSVTVGGNNLYLQEAFRGVIEASLTTGAYTRVTAAIAHWDGGDFRGGSNIIYYGNDSQPTAGAPDPRPPIIYRGMGGNFGSGVALANVNGVPMMFVNESAVSGIVGITGR